jgi:hypothetical protein
MTDDSDPFRSFRQLFEQFDMTDSASIPGVGWPLSPVPIPGDSVVATSPEASTKQAVKQLYSALAALSESESVAATGDAWSQYLDAFEFDTTAFGPEQLAAATLRTYRIWFFSLTQVLVESYTLRLVHDELVVETHRQKTGTQKWLWGLPQSDREQLLERCTDVPGDLVAEMRTLRHRRDKLLYTFGGWDDVEFDDSLEELRSTLEVLTALDDRVTDGSPFSYFPKNTETGDADSADENAADADEDIEDNEF